MKVKIKNSLVTITGMTVDELGMLRYALSKGAWEMRSFSNYNKSMKNEFIVSSTESANRAEKLSADLETAVQAALGR